MNPAPDNAAPRPPSLTLRQTRDLLGEIGLHPSRKLGQNFLIDGNIVKKSIELAGIASGETVVEIGPGLGTLTRALLQAGCRVFAVEKDRRLCAFLEERLGREAPDRFFLVAGDALRHPLAALPAENARPFKIVANLPYAISTPWLDGVLSGPALPERMVLMLQRETADRFTAEIGGKSMSAITLFLQSAYTTERGHRVPRRCFFPAPEVDSRLLNLKKKTDPHLFASETKALVHRCFGQRRKQIGALLRKFAPEPVPRLWLECLAGKGFSPQTRPEAVPVPLWRELDRIVRSG